MNQLNKQTVLPKSLENKITGMKKLLKQLMAQLDVLIIRKTKSSGTPSTFAKSAAITLSKNR